MHIFRASFLSLSSEIGYISICLTPTMLYPPFLLYLSSSAVINRWLATFLLHHRISSSAKMYTPWEQELFFFSSLMSLQCLAKCPIHSKLPIHICWIHKWKRNFFRGGGSSAFSKHRCHLKPMLLRWNVEHCVFCHYPKHLGTEHVRFQAWQFGEFQKFSQFTFPKASSQTPFHQRSPGKSIGTTPHPTHPNQPLHKLRPGRRVLYISSINNCQTDISSTDSISHLSHIFWFIISPKGHFRHFTSWFGMWWYILAIGSPALSSRDWAWKDGQTRS